MAEKKTNSVAVWGTTIFLAVMFVAAGWMKITGSDVWAAERQHYADWFFKSIGVLEMVAALLLLYPKSAWVGAATLAVIMVGAVLTELVHAPIKAVVPGLFLISLSALAFYRLPRRSPPT